jgi:hypothetical protein
LLNAKILNGGESEVDIKFKAKPISLYNLAKNEQPLRFFVASRNKVVNFKKQNLIGKLKNT